MLVAGFGLTSLSFARHAPCIHACGLIDWICPCSTWQDNKEEAGAPDSQVEPSSEDLGAAYTFSSPAAVTDEGGCLQLHKEKAKLCALT